MTSCKHLDKCVYGIAFALSMLLLSILYAPSVHASTSEIYAGEQKPMQVAWFWVHRDRYYTYRNPGYRNRYWTDWHRVAPACHRSCLVENGYRIRCVRQCY